MEKKCDMQANVEWYIRGIVLFSLFWKLLIEIYQFFGGSCQNFCQDYCGRWKNFSDLLTLLTNGGTLFGHIIIQNDVEGNKKEKLTLLRQIAAIGLIFIWLEMFNWFRLFDSTAQYVDLVQSTIKDIGYFMLVFLQILMMFAFAFYMIQVSMFENEKILYDYN